MQAIQPQRRLHDQNSMNFQEMASVCSPRTSISSTETPVSKVVPGTYFGFKDT